MSLIDTIALDVVLSEKFTERVTTTEHPVETGTDPTDHVRKMPGTLMIEAMFTNTPIPYDPDRGPAQEGRGGYAARQYAALRALVLGKALTVETGARTYKNMQITELAQSRDSKTGTDSIQFTCQLKEIIFVNTASVQLERLPAVTSIKKKPTTKEEQAKQNPNKKDQSALDHLSHYFNNVGNNDLASYESSGRGQGVGGGLFE